MGKKILDINKHNAQQRLISCDEPHWQRDISYFWAKIIKMKRRALLREQMKNEKSKHPRPKGT